MAPPPAWADALYWILMVITFLICVTLVVRKNQGEQYFGENLYLGIMIGMIVFCVAIIITYIVLRTTVWRKEDPNSTTNNTVTATPRSKKSKRKNGKK